MQTQDHLTVWLTISLLTISGCNSEQRSTRSTAQSQETAEAAYLKQADDAIDIGTASLLVSEGIDPNVNVQDYLDRIDRLSGAIDQHTQDRTDAAHIIEVINSHVYGDNQVQYQIDKHFINDVFDHGQGNCMALVCLYLAIGQRLGLPLRAVSVAGHVFVRYQDSQVTLNIETTAQGQIRDDIFYKKMIAQSPESSLSKVKQLRVLTTRQLLCKLLLARGVLYRHRQQYHRAIEDFHLAIELDQGYPGAYNNRGSLYAEAGQYRQAIMDYNRAIHLHPHYTEAYNNRALAYACMQDRARALRE